MNRRSAFVALGMAGALAFLAAPAAAQHHRDGGGEHHDKAAPRADSHSEHPQAQTRTQAQPQQREAVPRYATPRYDGGRYYGPRYAGPRFAIAPRHFFRPYYVFRPRLSIGFGLWAGYPVTYYQPYYYPYDYYPYATPPPQGAVGVQPYQADQANMGGLSFDIMPATAEVYIDGNFFGEVGQFTAATQPLGLPAGRHHVELREPGFQVMSFDVDILAGQVIPYQGQLQP